MLQNRTTISSSLCKCDCACANHMNKFLNVEIKTRMQIRHSYSIGSIVPFSSSTTFTSTNKNKDSSKCISYRPGPRFLTCKNNSVSPTGVCLLSAWTGAFPSAPSWESLPPLLRGRSSLRFFRAPFAKTETGGSWVLKGLPTSSTPAAGKDLRLACTGASFGVGLQATGFGSVPERRSGHRDGLW